MKAVSFCGFQCQNTYWTDQASDKKKNATLLKKLLKGKYDSMWCFFLWPYNPRQNEELWLLWRRNFNYLLTYDFSGPVYNRFPRGECITWVSGGEGALDTPGPWNGTSEASAIWAQDNIKKLSRATVPIRYKANRKRRKSSDKINGTEGEFDQVRA